MKKADRTRSHSPIACRIYSKCWSKLYVNILNDLIPFLLIYFRKMETFATLVNIAHLAHRVSFQ